MKVCALQHRVWYPKMAVSPTMSLGRDAMDLPRQLRERSHIFVMPTLDLFAQPTNFIKQVFYVMNREGRHEFQVSTRHPERALEMGDLLWSGNVWLGAVIDDVESGTERLDTLRKIPAQVRFAHVRVATTVPQMHLREIAFVIVEAAVETAAIPGGPELEAACKTANIRLFEGARVETAELRTPAPATHALATRASRLSRGR